MSIKAFVRTKCNVIVVTIMAISGVLALNSCSYCACPSCGNAGMQGISIESRYGTTSVVPIAGGLDLGPGAPGQCDANNLPGSGNLRNLGSSTMPEIKWGISRITLNSTGDVLFDGVIAAKWTWDSNTKTLSTPDNRAYVFDNSAGMLTSMSGPNRTKVTTYQYDTNHLDRITQVTDNLGNVWTYGVDLSKPGPSDVINPDRTHKVVFNYVPAGSYGEGQYSQVIVYKWSSSTWVEQERTSYTYDSNGRIIEINTSNATNAGDPSVTNVEYVNGNEGERNNPVRRIHNSKLRIDICYEYGTELIPETYGGSYTYGYTQIRRRANYSDATSYVTSDNDNSTDLVNRIYYYQNANSQLDYVYKDVQLISDGSGGIRDYAVVKYQVGGYLSRFDANPPSYMNSLVGKLWKVIDANGNFTTYTYSSSNSLVTRIDFPTGDYMQCWYKQIENKDSVYLEKIRDERGKFTKYTRDVTFPKLITKIEVSDDDITYTTIKQMSYYNTPSQKQGMLQQVTVPNIEGTNAMVNTFDYEDVIGSNTIYRSIPTKKTSSWYNPETSSYEDVTSTTSTYSDLRVRSKTDNYGHKTDYVYDDESRLVKVLLPGNPSDSGTVGSYTSTSVTDSSKTWLPNQLMGMVFQVTSGKYNGNIYNIQQNSENIITIKNDTPLPSDLGVPTYPTYIIRPKMEYHHNSCCGLVDIKTDLGGHKTYYTYDSVGHVIEIRNDVTNINNTSSTYPLVRYTYNDLGWKTKVETYTADQTNSRATAYTYDQLGRIIKVTYPDNNGTRILYDTYYQFDTNSNLVAKLDGSVDDRGNIVEGNITVFGYDSLDRLVKIKYNYSASSWPINDIIINAPDVEYAYSGGSDYQSTVTAGAAVWRYAYDAKGCLSTYQPAIPGNYNVNYEFDATNHKKSLVVKDLSGNDKFRILYLYYRNSQLKQVIGQEFVSGNWVSRAQVEYDRDANGNVLRRNNSLSDVQTTYTYDVHNDPLSISHNASSNQYCLTYRWNSNGFPLEIAFSGNAFRTPYPNTDRVRYSYSANNKLIGQDWGYLNGPSWESINNLSWNYDWMGNQGNSSDYNSVDEYRSGNGYVYDELGNLVYQPDNLSATRTQYHYNQLNLLSQVDDVTPIGSLSTILTWDPDFQRAMLQRGNNSWRYLYDLTADDPSTILEQYDNSSITVDTFFVRDPDGQLLASFTPNGENIRYYHSDYLGNIILVSNGNGAIIDSSTYSANGDTLATNLGIRPYRWGGELGCYTHDGTSQGNGLANLVQLGIRFYDPTTRRFTQRDFFGFAAGLNWYEYADSNPTTYIDPWGLCFGNKGGDKIIDIIREMISQASDKAEIIDLLAKALKSKKKANEVWDQCQPLIDFTKRRKKDPQYEYGNGPTEQCASCCQALADAMGSSLVVAGCEAACIDMFCQK